MTTTSRNTWEYKPPAAKDIPQDFRVTLLPNARNPHGVLSSKVICIYQSILCLVDKSGPKMFAF